MPVEVGGDRRPVLECASRLTGGPLVGDELPLIGSAAGAISQGCRSGSRSSSAVEEPHYQDRITFDDVVDGIRELLRSPRLYLPATTKHARGFREISSLRA